MAEDGPKKSDTRFEDMMLFLFGVLLAMNFLQALPNMLQDTLGVSINSPYLTASAALTADTPIGTPVSAVNGATFYSEPGAEGEGAGAFAPGSALVIVDGSKEADDGSRWWYVENKETGERGWVREEDLVRSGVGGVNATTPLDTKVQALLDTSLWRFPGGSEKVGTMAKGDVGTLTGGPEEVGGMRWWFFDRADSDEDGWVPESALVLATENDWRVGYTVKATRNIDLFERAGGGAVLGSKQKEEEMKLVGGPVLVGGEYWWLVEGEDGVQGWVPESALEEGGLRGWFKGVVSFVLFMAVVITVLLLAGIMYATIRISQIRTREARRIKAAMPKKVEPKKNERWEKVYAHGQSENPNDWRLAIIESDIMLDELVTRMGYMGTTLGEKLKQAARGDFKTLDAAWEAHRIRNQIAHEGSDFILTQREAKRVLALYQSVFEEFKYTD